jgi:hypothetical protein
MITLFDQFNDTQPHQNQVPDPVTDHVINEYLGSYEPRLLYFESPWLNDLYDKQNMRPFIENIDHILLPPVHVGYKTFYSAEQLRFYLKWPNGEAWKNEKMWGNSLTTIACHGYPSGLQPTMGLIPHDELQEIFTDFGSDTSTVLYFSSCHLFQEKERGRELLEASKCQGIFGFQGEIGYATGALLDLILISTFYLYLDENIFKHLTEIYEFVMKFPPAQEAGFTLFVP